MREAPRRILGEGGHRLDSLKVGCSRLAHDLPWPVLSPPACFSQVSPTPAPRPGTGGPQPCDSVSWEQPGEEWQPLRGGHGLQTS